MNRTVRTFLALAAVGTAAEALAAEPAPERPRTRRALNLFAVTNAVMDVNRVFCGINNLGEICVDPTNSPVLGGGFWPKGTPDQYIFNSGLQIAGIIDPNAGFSWAGDTTGAYFFDARGTQVQGDAVTLVYNSLDPNDAANWPNGAVVRNAATPIYNSVLVGRQAISQQDLWTRAWDGNPALLSGRTHPMGILVEERGLAWNYPTGNEDIIYFVFTFYNITARNPAVYQNPTIPAEIQGEIAQIGAQFQDRNEAAFGLQIPDNGYAITNLYAAFSMDPDVGDASHNYSTAILPFNMGVAYKSDFLEPTWTFPADIFGPPFVPSPGFIGVKYLKSPVVAGQEVGLTMFSNTLNAATGFPDPVGVIQLWRYLSGNVSTAAGDNPCTFPGQQQARRYCFLAQNFADTRFYQSSGPFTLNPGEAQTIVVAYVHAAPTPAVLPFIGGDMKPGIPPSGAGLAAATDTLRTVERGAGWLSHADTGGAPGGGPNGVIDQFEVRSVPRSLLDKALVAQAVFDNRFLLPFAPEPPTFFVVPGDNQVTVTWQPSETETVRTGGGDPFFAIASDPTSPLYDPNFRQYDVEGYRIYRGRTSGQLELVAQFDYAGTVITDYTGAFAYAVDADGDGLSECAPELGITDDCPVDFAGGESVDHPLVGEIVQIPAGGRVELANGSVLILKADTAVTGGNSGYRPLEDTGVGFAYVDRGVRNSFRYFYAVTAFDVNSLKSGPSSIESPRITKAVTPRKPATTVRSTVLVQSVTGSDGATLDPAAPWPTIDAANGTFTGVIPPANDGAMSIIAGLELLPSGDITLRIDSVGPGFTGGIGAHPNIYMTISAGGSSVTKVINLPEPDFTSSSAVTYDFGAAGEALVPYDSARARLFGVRFTKDTRLPISFGAAVIPVAHTSIGIALTEGRFNVGGQGSRYLAHSRWFDFGGNEPPDPTIVAYPDSSKNSGRLTGVGRIWAPAAYRDRVNDRGSSADAAGPNGAVNLFMRGYGYAQTAWYPADFVVTWNADSSITVRDSTHRSTLPFAPNGGTGWGFINLRAYQAAGVATVEIEDGTGSPDVAAALGYHHLYATQPTCYPDWWAITCVQLERKAQFQPLDFNWDGARDADGIALMINGEAFLMEMSQIPAAGTRWRLRAVTGSMSATCTPALGPLMTDCSGYTFTPRSVRPSYAPGLTYRISVQQQYQVDSTAAGDLANVHTVPDPYYVTNALEQTANTKVLKFVNLPPRAIIRIYSVSGILVQVVTHNDPAGGGEATWNLRNRNEQFVASGVYFYHVEAPDGRTKVGRFTVVNFAQ
ncbi:MAG TPA: hypothetical protein VNI61_06795 [Gemmatimonadales bacterium]|nr:hypothetical protein [Gemmatimonadales bacterium]